MARHNASSTGEAKKKGVSQARQGQSVNERLVSYCSLQRDRVGALQQIIAGSLPLTFLIPNVGEKENST